MDGDFGGTGDGDPTFFAGGPWLLLFAGVGLVIGTVQSAVQGQGVVALMCAGLAAILFAMSYVFFDRKRDT